MLGNYMNVSYADYHNYKNEYLWKIILRKQFVQHVA